MPETYTVEWWAYFAQDGDIASLRGETRDDASGAIVQRAELVDSALIMTDIASGEQLEASAFSPTVELLRATILDAQSSTADLANPEASAERVVVGGDELFVVETRREDQAGFRRVYIHPTDYREMKWERIAVDASGAETVVESRETPVFEFIQGEVE